MPLEDEIKIGTTRPIPSKRTPPNQAATRQTDLEKIEADNVIFRLHNINSPNELRRIGRTTVVKLREVEGRTLPAPKRKRSIRKTVWLFLVGASSLIICSSLTWFMAMVAFALEGFSSVASAVTGVPATWGIVSIVVGIVLQALVIVGVWFLLKGASRFYDSVMRENTEHLRQIAQR